MAAIVLPSRWLRQPPYQVELKRAHPLAMGLVSFVPLVNAQLSDVCKAGENFPISTIIGNPTVDNGLGGIGYRTNGTSSYLAHSTTPVGAMPLSWLHVGSTFATSGVAMSSLVNTTNWTGVYLQSNATGSDCISANNQTFDGISSVAHAPGLRAVAGRFAANNVRGAVNGVLGNLDAALTTPTGTWRFALGASYRGSTDSYWAGHHNAFAMWNRGLSDEELIEVSRAPYQALKRRVHRTYFDFVAAGLSTSAAIRAGPRSIAAAAKSISYASSVIAAGSQNQISAKTVGYGADLRASGRVVIAAAKNIAHAVAMVAGGRVAAATSAAGAILTAAVARAGGLVSTAYSKVATSTTAVRGGGRLAGLAQKSVAFAQALSAAVSTNAVTLKVMSYSSVLIAGARSAVTTIANAGITATASLRAGARTIATAFKQSSATVDTKAGPRSVSTASKAVSFAASLINGARAVVETASAAARLTSAVLMAGLRMTGLTAGKAVSFSMFSMAGGRVTVFIGLQLDFLFGRVHTVAPEAAYFMVQRDEYR